MQFNLLINGGLYSTQAAYTAWQFAQAALQAGHSISQVFFYQDGVSHATALATPLSDEFDASNAWASLAQQHNIPLVACISAAERRGVLGAEQAQEAGQAHYNLHPSFTIAGLGALHDASLSSDRTVSFK